MPRYLSNELAGTTTGLTTADAVAVGYKPRASVYQSNLKRLRCTVRLAAQQTSPTDDILLGVLPAGATFAFGKLTTSVSLGTSTIAIGTTGATAKYRAAATFTAVDTPTDFGIATQIGAADPALSADEPVLLTIGAAALPASGTLVVDIFYSHPN